MKVFMKKAILNNTSIANEGLLAYIGLTYQLQKGKIVFTSVDILCAILQGSKESYMENRALYNKVKTGIENLQEIGIIKKLYDIKKYGFALDCSDLILDTERESFIILESELINKIISTPSISVDKAVRFLCVLVASINTDTGVGFTSIEKLAERSSISKKQAIALVKRLEENKSLYVHRSDEPARLANGRFLNRPNQYILL